ncbi:MAG: UbiD family decarboxylase, partial [Acidobacteria bacterium]|nr:UbiD family decarboxylase [Acidobacteriota bacterium]
MAYNDLRDWISALERAGELKRIKTEADPVLEIAEITDRVSKSKDRNGKTGGPALLFENPRANDIPVLINQFGSERRMRLALDVDSLDEVAGRIRQFMDVKSPGGFLDKVKMLPLLADMGKFFPRTVSSGPAKEVIRRSDFDLNRLPVLQCWPQDAGRFITLPCVITRHPKTGKRNVGLYRMQVYDGQTTGMHWQRQKIGAEHYREMLRGLAAGDENPRPLRNGAGAPPQTAKSGLSGRPAESKAVDIMARTSGGSVIPEGELPPGRMEVAVAVGTDPALTFSAIVPAPP